MTSQAQCNNAPSCMPTATATTQQTTSHVSWSSVSLPADQSRYTSKFLHSDDMKSFNPPPVQRSGNFSTTCLRSSCMLGEATFASKSTVVAALDLHCHTTPARRTASASFMKHFFAILHQCSNLAQAACRHLSDMGQTPTRRLDSCRIGSRCCRTRKHVVHLEPTWPRNLNCNLMLQHSLSCDDTVCVGIIVLACDAVLHTRTCR